MEQLFTLFQQTLNEEALIAPGDHVLIALSGGADSVALLKAFTFLREEWNLTLTAAHVHHGIRGEEADRDLELVQSLCQTLEVPCLVHRVNIPQICEETGEGEEECGRRIRYEFFRSVQGIDKIATAHTLNDSAETVLLHLIRGSGLQGLRGILPRRDNIIRPLIGCTRLQVEEFCQQHRLPFATDSTNSNTAYHRNFVRHNLLPLCEQLNPAFLESIARCTHANQKDFDYLSTFGEQLLQGAKTQKGYCLAPLQQAHPAVLRYALQHLMMQEQVPNLTQNHWHSLELLIQKGEGKCSLPNDTTLCAFQGVLYFEKEKEQPFAPIDVSVQNQTYDVWGKTVTFALCPPQKVSNLLTYPGPDGDKIGRYLQLRTRREGDRITLAHRGCSKSLKKLFNELKIPHHERDQRLVLCDEQGILWVEGVGCDARCAPNQTTKQQVYITIQ